MTGNTSSGIFHVSGSAAEPISTITRMLIQDTVHPTDIYVFPDVPVPMEML